MEIDTMGPSELRELEAAIEARRTVLKDALVEEIRDRMAKLAEMGAEYSPVGLIPNGLPASVMINGKKRGRPKKTA